MRARFSAWSPPPLSPSNKVAMSSTAHKLPITAAEYLEGELRSETRHEFVDGRVYAMSGASRRHDEICLDLASILQAHLRGSSCRTYIEALKVRVADDLGGSYYYPGVFVACEPGDDDSHVVSNPKLVIEVLSDSTLHSINPIHFPKTFRDRGITLTALRTDS
jgi:Uma2 family endonuclease